MSMAEVAFAEDTNLEKITITGSTIRRTETETALPVEVITKADIEKSGKQTLADVVNSITSNNNGTVPISFGAGFAHGAQGVALRGLSVNSTLVLINGRRMASYGLTDDGQRSFVDLNSIPLDAVEEIQILKDGASATYGSDAIAGVVNIIMAKSYVGGTGTYDLGQSGHGDGSEYHAAVKYGVGDMATDRYNFFVDVELQHQSQIMGSQRGGYIGSLNLNSIGQGDERPGGYPLDPNSLGRGSLVGNVLDLTTGAIQSLPGCAPGNVDANGLCRWEESPYTQIQPDIIRRNIYGRATTALSGGGEAFLEFGVFDARTDSIGTPNPTRATVYSVQTGKVVSQAINLAVGNPYNPFPDVSRLYTSTASAGGRNSDDNSQQYRFVAGIKGSVQGWDWDADIGYTHSKLKSNLSGYLLYNELKAAVGAGQQIPGIQAAPGGVFTGTVNLAQISPTLTTNGSSSNNFIDLHTQHDLFTLPGGASAFSLGVEVRHETLDSPAVPHTAEGDVLGLGYAQSQDTRNVYALYGEILLPVTKQFNIDVAARDDHYSTYGNSFTPKVGLDFTPIESLKLRGSASSGFRAPSSSEAGKTSASAGYVPNFTDPQCANFPGANCVGSIGVISIGNPQLHPETSSNFTAGFVLSPTRSFDMTADLYKIIRRHEITQADPTAALTNPSSYPGLQIIRDPAQNNTLLAVGAPYINANQTTTSGFDLIFVGRTPLPAGNLKSILNIDHIMTFKRDFGGGFIQNYAGNHGPVVMSSGAGMPATRVQATFDYSNGPLDVTTTVNYRSHIQNTDGNLSDCSAVANEAGALQAPCFTPSFTTFDLSAHYDFSKQWQLNGSVRNLFDRTAPYDPVAYAYLNTNATYDGSGLIGRFFNIGVRYTMPK